MNRIEEWRAGRVAEAHRLAEQFNEMLGLSLVVVEEPRLEIHATDSDFGALSRWSRSQPDTPPPTNVYGDIPVVVVRDPEPHVSGREDER